MLPRQQQEGDIDDAHSLTLREAHAGNSYSGFVYTIPCNYCGLKLPCNRVTRDCQIFTPNKMSTYNLGYLGQFLDSWILFPKRKDVDILVINNGP